MGRFLVDTFEADALQRGYQPAQVKTLGPSHPDEGYAATRRFYAALGTSNSKSSTICGRATRR